MSQGHVQQSHSEPSGIASAFQSSPKTVKTLSKQSKIPMPRFRKLLKSPQSPVIARSTIQPYAAVAGPSGVSAPGPSGYRTPTSQFDSPRRSLKKQVKKGFSKGAKKVRSLFKTPSGPVTPDTPDVRRADTSPEDYEEYREIFEESHGIAETPPKTSPRSVSPSRDIPRISFTPPYLIEPITDEAASAFERTPRPGTPFVSTSRFGFTDPSVPLRKLNIPPGPFEVPTPFRQTIVLTSPKRKEPVFVNIGVEPSNLIDTEKGECFVCDVKLDVQPGGLLPQLQLENGGVSPYEPDMSPDRSLEMSDSPIIKGRYRGRRNVPPDITPTSTRRKQELFTPRGIFKRGQLNIRRIPGKHPISELPWSPTYLPEDARSPITSLASPLRWSDRSVSWEKQNESDYISSPSSSPVIKRPTYMYRSPDFLLSSSSPIIKGPSYGYPSPASDLSPSPIIKRPSYRYQSPDSDLSSPSPVIQRPDYVYRSSDSDRSSRSPIPAEQLGSYSSPVLPLGTSGRTSASDSMDSERGYLEGSLGSSLLNEARFLN